MDGHFDGQFARLQNLTLEKLRQEWRNAFETDPPACRSREVVRQLLAWRIQEKALGGLSPESRRRLKQLAGAFGRNPDHKLAASPLPKPGTVLVREWKGVLHRVQILREGFEYEGERFDSLSEAARKITGTRWSGPLFFGLKPSTQEAKP
ncbi:MAG: DUF2924 domain-containing protein [Nitrospinota bacterium]